MDLTSFVLNPATLLVLVFGVVEFVKSLGLEGNKLRWISMGIGIVLAVVFQLTTLFPVVSPYVETLFYGLAVGLGACGIYSFLNNRLPVKKEG